MPKDHALWRRFRFGGLLAVAIALSLPIQPAFSSKKHVKELTNENGLDLSEMVWWQVVKASPESATEQTSTRIPMPLRRPLVIEEENHETYLVCNFHVAAYDTPESLYYGTEVVIGDIDGNDQTYWNDTLIGQTTGRSLSATGRYRRYKVPRDAIQFGAVNQLRILVTGLGGSKTVTRINQPTTIAPLSPAPAEWQLREYQDQLGQLTREVYRLSRWKPDFLPLLEFMAQREDVWIEIDQAWKLIEQGRYRLLRESFEEIESALDTLRELSRPLKRSIARIEREKYELDMLKIAGLEGVHVRRFADLEKRGWKPPAARPESFSRWGWFSRDGLPTLKEVTPGAIEDPDGRRISLIFNRVLDVQVVDINWVSKTYLVRAELELLGRTEVATFEIGISVFYPGMMILPMFEPFGEVLRPETIQKFFDMRTKYFTQIPARPPGEKGSVILGWDGPEEDRPTMLRFTPSHFDPLGLFITTCFPGGLRRVDTRSWSRPGETPKDLRLFPVIEYLSRNFPWQCREYYRYDERSNRIQVYDVFEYYYRPQDNQYLVIAPPVLSFAMAKGYPVEVKPKLKNLGIDTFYGPLQGNYAKGGVLSYSLPVPSLEERALPAAPMSQELQELLDRSVGGWEKTEATNGVDALYKGITAAYNAWFQLSPEVRKSVASAARSAMVTGLKENCWPQYVEPFSGLSVSWTYDLQGPYYDSYDQEWGNGLSLYGLCKYSQYSGDWTLVRRRVEMIEKIWSWFIHTDDWAWMRCSNARHGHGTGAGDCSLAAFSGAWAYAKMARQIGPPMRTEEGLYLLARSAVPLLARFHYTPWAQEEDWIESEEMVLGFHEGEGFLRGRLDGYPWDVTSLISGNGIHPEAMSFLLEYAGPQLEQYVKTFEQHYPEWDNGNYSYPSKTLYEGNSGYITMPHLYLRSRMGWPAASLEQSLERAKTNRAMWWVAPPALAELNTGRSGVLLTRWEPAALREARMTGSEVNLDFLVMRKGTQVGLRLEHPPKICWVNGKPYSQWTYDRDSKEFLLKSPGAAGRCKIRVQWEPPADPEGEQP